MASELKVIWESDGVVHWRLNRPAVRNAIDGALLGALAEAAEEVRGSKNARAVILVGEGDDAFCAGADLKERRGMGDDAVLERLGLYRSVLGAIESLPVPTVAAIHGYALGGGFELALACDFRVATKDATFGFPEVRLGIIPGAGGTQRLTRLVGAALAKSWILSAEHLSAAEVARAGALHALATDRDELETRCRKLLLPMLEAPREALAAALEAIDAAEHGSREHGMMRETSCYEMLLKSPARKMALEAFAKKRANLPSREE